MKILNAKDLTIAENPALPYQSHAIYRLFQILRLKKVEKQQIDGYTQEILIPLKILGVVQPLTSQKLMIKPEGQRHWKWQMLHCEAGVPINLDDVILIQRAKYRVLEKANYSQYGYEEFHLAEDFYAST